VRILKSRSNDTNYYLRHSKDRTLENGDIDPRAYSPDSIDCNPAGKQDHHPDDNDTQIQNSETNSDDGPFDIDVQSLNNEATASTDELENIGHPTGQHDHHSDDNDAQIQNLATNLDERPMDVQDSDEGDAASTYIGDPIKTETVRI
jgi:hypothetical protein